MVLDFSNLLLLVFLVLFSVLLGFEIGKNFGISKGYIFGKTDMKNYFLKNLSKTELDKFKKKEYDAFEKMLREIKKDGD